MHDKKNSTDHTVLHESTHQASFDRIYARLPQEDSSFDFPLAQRDQFDFGRGAYRNPFQRYLAKRFNVHYLAKLDLAPNMSVLSLGCGRGYEARTINKLYPGMDQWSVDISREMIKRSIQGNSPGEFAIACAEALPFPNNCFDRILSVEVIEHVMDQQQMLHEIHRVLAPGGIAVITTENEESLAPTNSFADGLRKGLRRLGGELPSPPAYQDQAPTRAQFITMCEEAELDIMETFYDGALYQTLPRFPTLIKGKTLARMAHFASALENRPSLAHLFCDQIKYVVKKPITDARKTLPHYTEPGGGSSLTKKETYFLAPLSGNRFPITEEVPDFISRDKKTPHKGTTNKHNPQKPLSRNWQKTYFRFADWIILKAYASVILAVGVGASILCPSNKHRITRHLPENHPLIRYLDQP
jgi:ubiquinone/menaquinone biosynthesis C-methylase UbiE